MYVIKTQDEIIYAKYETIRTILADGEVEVSRETFESIDVPCTLSREGDGEITCIRVEAPVIEGVSGITPKPFGPSLEQDMMVVLVDHEARLAAVEEGVTL